jgi:hypothetical protein
VAAVRRATSDSKLLEKFSEGERPMLMPRPTVLSNSLLGPGVPIKDWTGLD